MAGMMGMMSGAGAAAGGGIAQKGLLESARGAQGELYNKAMDMRGGLLDDFGMDEELIEGLGSGAAGHMANVQAGQQLGNTAEANAVKFLARTRALQGQNMGMGGQY